MIILSQKGETIINFRNINYIDLDVQDKEIYASLSNNEDVFLGEYKTEERAKEVLQDILVKYSTYEEIQNEVNDVIGIAEKPKVYVMPKE